MAAGHGCVQTTLRLPLSQEGMQSAEEAASQAAREDAVVRSLRKAEGTRDQLQRLKVRGGAGRGLRVRAAEQVDQQPSAPYLPPGCHTSVC
jgi:hypothetical protein